MEGSRCSRVNGRGWRCCQQTLVGYSLCEHHLGKGRLRSMTNVRSSNVLLPLPGEQRFAVVSFDRTKSATARSWKGLKFIIAKTGSSENINTNINKNKHQHYPPPSTASTVSTTINTTINITHYQHHHQYHSLPSSPSLTASSTIDIFSVP